VLKLFLVCKLSVIAATEPTPLRDTDDMKTLLRIGTFSL